MKKIIFLSLFWIGHMYAWSSPTFSWVWSAECEFSKEEHHFIEESMDALYQCIQKDVSLEEINEKVAAICEQADSINYYGASPLDRIFFELEAQISRFETSLIDGKQYLKNVGRLAAGSVLGYGTYLFGKYMADYYQRHPFAPLHETDFFVLLGGAIGSLYLVINSKNTLEEEHYAEFYHAKYSLVRDALKQHIANKESKEYIHE